MDITKVDLYGLLDILQSATTQEVKKAYRKKALQCHPDKNPDNPKAAELFHQLSRALEVLTDESARAAYDKVLNAKKAAELRNKELDSRRKKLKEDLEARERQAQFVGRKEPSPEEKLKVEIERLRKEGSKQLEEEIEFVRRQVQQEKFGSSEEVDSTLFRLKITWNLNSDPESHSYSHESLTKIFSKYGEIAALVVSSKKKNSAILEFTSSTAAIKGQQLEKGFLSNPLTVSWLSGSPPGQTQKPRPPEVSRSKGVPNTTTFPSMTPASSQPPYKSFPCFPSAPDIFTKKREEKEELDFENAVLSRMRQAEEEKRRAANNLTDGDS